MGMSSKVGSFNVTTGAVDSTQEISDAGFQPKVVIFWWVGRTDSTDAAGRADKNQGMGAAVSSTERYAHSTFSGDALSASDGGLYRTDAGCIIVADGTGALTGALDLVSMDNDGFTLIVDVQMPAAIRVHYLALGGDDLTNVKVSSFATSGSEGNQSVTDTGFQPDVVLIMGTGANVATIPYGNSTNDNQQVGAAMSSTNRYTTSVVEDDGSNTMDTDSYSYDGECYSMSAGAGGDPVERADFVEFLSNGFTVNFLESVYPRRIGYVALKGGQYALKDGLTQTNTTTDIVISGAGFQPVAGLVVSHCKAKSTQDTSQAHWDLSIGGFTSTSNRAAVGCRDLNGAADSTITTAVEHDEVYANVDGGSVVGLMDVKSIDSGGATFIMDVADPAQAFFWVLLIGASSSGQTYNEATTLTRSAGVGQTVLATYDGKATLARAAGMTQTMLATYSDGMTLARAAGIAQTMLATYEDGMTLSRAAGIAQTMLATYADGMTLSRAAGIAQVVLATYADGMTLARSAGISQDAAGSIYGAAMSLARSLGITQSGGLALFSDVSLARSAGDAYVPGLSYFADVSLGRAAGDAYLAAITMGGALSLARSAGITSSMLATYDGKAVLGKGLGLSTVTALDLPGVITLARLAGMTHVSGLSYLVGVALARSASVITVSELIAGSAVADMYVIVPVTGVRFYPLSPYNPYTLTDPIVAGDRVKFWVDTKARHNLTGMHNLRDPDYGWLTSGNWGGGAYALILDSGVSDKSQAWVLIEGVGVGTTTVSGVLQFNTHPAPGSLATVYLNVPIYPGSETWLPNKPASSSYGIVLDYAARRNGHGAHNYIDFGDTVTGMAITTTGGTSFGYELTSDNTIAVVTVVGGAAGEVCHVVAKATLYSGQTKTVALRMRIT